ncbi:MAG: cysteine--tRNA ligase [Alphaproteobacteria bacterium]|nr:cysteine--tRNA ligase [Alphaproteobacteria bacterium]
MALHIYNTLHHKKELIEPLKEGHFGMYVCGPTVYDRVHIGNARPYVIFDILYRLLKRSCKVLYVRNLTDVDDKINKRAREIGSSIHDLTVQTIGWFHEDMQALGLLEPSHEPRATQHVPEMIAMIQNLIDKGHAYTAEGHVLYSVDSLREYGCLSRHNRDELIAGARVEIAPYKRDPADFVLWKPSDSETPGWKSPWGFGRPGWHIECSAMSCRYLGPTFDLHGGGQDLVFPHHENELAQSTGAHGPHTFARYWMHNGMLTVNGEKMSKSLGNFVTVREALQKFHGETIRYILISSHYRQQLDWTDEGLSQSKSSLDRLYICLRGLVDDGHENAVDPKILEALEDDLNTPLALSRLHEIATSINKAKSSKSRMQLMQILKASGQILGLFGLAAEDWFTWRSAAAADSLNDEDIKSLIAERIQARVNKDFSAADLIRDKLLAQGIHLEDTPNGTLWRR